MMRRYCFFDPSTGLFDGSVRDFPQKFNVETADWGGLIPIEGSIDVLSKRVDLEAFERWQAKRQEIADLVPEAGEATRRQLVAQAEEIKSQLLLEHIPDSPGDDYEWNPVKLRWVLTDRAKATQVAQQRIRALEATQPRAVREALLGQGTERLATIEAQIAEQRVIINASRQR